MTLPPSPPSTPLAFPEFAHLLESANGAARGTANASSGGDCGVAAADAAAAVAIVAGVGTLLLVEKSSSVVAPCFMASADIASGNDKEAFLSAETAAIKEEGDGAVTVETAAIKEEKGAVTGEAAIKEEGGAVTVETAWFSDRGMSRSEETIEGKEGRAAGAATAAVRLARRAVESFIETCLMSSDKALSAVVAAGCNTLPAAPIEVAFALSRDAFFIYASSDGANDGKTDGGGDATAALRASSMASPPLGQNSHARHLHH